MRSVRAAALTALSVLTCSVMFAQDSTVGLSVANYHFVSQVPVSPTVWNVTYQADLVNAGPNAFTSVQATLTSLTPQTIQTLAHQNVLNFANVPANGHVTSTNMFTIAVNRTATFSASSLQWAFSTVPGTPVANAGQNQTANVGSKVYLDGSGSTNPSGFGTLAYSWAFSSVPSGSAAVLLNPTCLMPTFVADAPGSYVIALTVSNGAYSNSASVTISTDAVPPVANAGPGQTVPLGATVTLDGSKSVAPNSLPLAYSWTLSTKPAGSQTALSDPGAVQPSFVVDVAGNYLAELTVAAGGVNSTPATTTVSTQDTPPVANAGPNQLVDVGSLVQLNGSGSTDVNGDPITYSWTLLSVPPNSNATLSNPASVNPTFTPDQKGAYVAQLIVNDGLMNSTAATVTVSTTDPLAPVSSAGPNQTIKHNTTVTLNGSATDPQGLPLTYQWAITYKPTGSTATLSNANTLSPSFYADLPGFYLIQLTVSNGFLASSSTTVVNTTNTPPVANPGTNQNVTVGATVTLNGSASTDADGDTLSYSWAFLSEPGPPAATLGGANTASPTFVANLAGTYIAQLIVSDPYSSSTPQNVTITAMSAQALTVTPNTLNLGPQPATVTVTLPTAAPANGATVTLFSYNAAVASVPQSFTIPAGSTTGTFAVTPVGVGSTDVVVGVFGFLPATVTVNVSAATLTVSTAGSAVGIGRTINGIVTLSIPAGSGGVTVALSASPAGKITLSAPSVTIPSGSLTGSFTVTGVALGSATITASAPGFGSSTTGVTVGNLGQINLQGPATLGPTQTATLQVSLATPAPAGGVTIALASSNTNVATVSVPSVTIAQGATTPTTQPTITGVNYGSTTFTASSTGYPQALLQSQVAATLSFSSTLYNIGPNTTQNVGLALSAPAPAGGLVVNLLSSNPGAATVPASVTFAANATAASVPVTTKSSPGQTTISASVSSTTFVTSASAVVNAGNVGTIVLPSNVTVGPGQSVAFPVNLSVAAPAGGLIVSLSSANTSIVAISPSTVTIPAGVTFPASQPQVAGVAFGTANINASAPAFVSASQPVQVAATISFTPASGSIPVGSNQNLTLNLSAPAPAGGLTINLNSSATGTATVPATVNFQANATTVLVPVTGVAQGLATITASGTSVGSATVVVTVGSLGAVILPTNVTVGPGQSVPFPITLPTPAPAGGATVSLTSANPAIVTVSPSTVTIPVGQTTPSTQPQVSGVSFGTANINASAPPAFASASQPVQVGATLSFSSPSYTIGTNATQNVTLNLSAPAPTGGLVVNLSSSNTAVATVPATVTIAASATSASVPVTTAGSTSQATISASSSAPNVTGASATVSVVSLGTIVLPANVTVSPNQSVAFPVSLSAQAPAGGITVSLSSANTSVVTISPSSVTIAPGQTTPPAQPTVTGVAFGTANISASAPAFVGISQPVQVAATISFTQPSGSIPAGSSQNLTLNLSSPAPATGLTINLSSSNTSAATVPATVSFAANATVVTVPVTGVAQGSATITASGTGVGSTTVGVTVSPIGTIVLPANVTVGPSQSAAFPVTLSVAAPAGGVTVSLSSANTSIVTISPATVTITTGQTTPSTQPTVTGVAFGTANINASATAWGSASQPVQVAATISFTAPTGSITAGSSQNLTLNLSAPAPASGLTINLSSSNTSTATVPATVSFAANAIAVTVPVTGVSQGSATITASGTGVGSTTVGVTVSALGTIMLPANVTVGPNQSVAFPVTLPAPAPAGGTTVTLSSANTSIVTISPATVTITTGQTTPSTQPTVTGVAFGSANINASAPGFVSASQAVQVAATISFTAPTGSITAGSNQNLTLNLSAPAPASGLTINLSSSNTGTATVPATVSFAANATAVTVPVTGVAPGSATITASGTGVANATVNVNVVSAGSIILPSGVNLVVGQSTPFPVSLSSTAPSGGVTVTLASGNSSIASVSPTSVFIASGQTVPSSQPQVTANGLGSVNISASTPLFNSASSPIQVTTAATFSPQSLTITAGVPTNLTLTLGAPAPAGGLTVSLSSSNTNVATVPLTVNIPATATSVNVPVTGLLAGSATISASGLDVGNPTAGVTVVSGSISLPSNVTVGPNQSVSFPVTLSVAATLDTTVTLSSGDPTTVTVSPASVTIPAGQTTPPTQPQVTGVNFGSANISASATGFVSASQPVQVTGTLSFSPASLTLYEAAIQNLTLTLSSPAPAAGLTVNLSSSDSTIALVPATVMFPANATSVSVPVMGSGTGSVTIQASNLPNLAATTASVTVNAQADIVIPSGVTVQPGQSVPLAVTLKSPAPSYGQSVTLTVGDPSVLTLNTTSIYFLGGTTTPQSTPTVTGVNFGSTSVSASGPGLLGSSQTVQVNETLRYLPNSVTVAPGNQQSVALILGTSLPFSWTVNLSSDNPAVATVPSTVLVPANQNAVSINVTGVAGGTTTIHASALPNAADTTATVTVTSPATINLPSNLTIQPTGFGNTYPVILGTPAPSGGVTVTLSSSNPAVATISTSTVSIASGQVSPASQPFVTGLTFGTTTMTASATGYTSASQALNVGATLAFQPNIGTVAAGSSQNLNLNLTLSAPAPAGGLTVNLSSQNTAVATVPSTVAFSSGATSVNVPVTGVALGYDIITASASAPNVTSASAGVTVTSASAGPLSIATSSLNGSVGTAMNAAIVPSGGTAPYTCFITGLPSPLTANNCAIVGTPSAVFSGNLTVSVTDSASPKGHASGTPSLTIISSPLAITPPTLPVGEQGVAYTAQVNATGGQGGYTFSGTLPVGLSISAAGAISGTPTGTFSGQITINVKDSVNSTATATPTLTVNAPLAITPPTLPVGEQGVAYTATVVATGGVTPYTFSGTLPVGLSISAAGAISGTPTGTFNGPVTINVKDSINATATTTPTLTVNASLAITPPTLPVGEQGVAYTATVVATGGIAPYTFSGTLPVGLSISAAGAISGTPTGTFNGPVTINVTDNVNATATTTPTLTVNAQLAITPPTLPVGEQGVAYTATVVATGGVTPYTFSGTLPVGLSISAAGAISGTPTGTFNGPVTINVKDNVNATATSTPTLTVNAPLAITPPTLPVGTVGVAYTTTVAATGGVTPYTFSGTLPVGLSISAAGQITGTPTGTFNGPVTINVKDNVNATATSTPTLTVNGALAITPPTLPVGEQGVAYTATVLATGGATPYTFSGTLPVGLSISSAGAISGTPTGTFSGQITINVKDNVNNTASATPTLTINAPLAITPPTLSVGEQGVAYTATVVATGGVTPYTFSGTLPVGLSISAAGAISGTPTGTFNGPVTINVKDNVNATATTSPTLTINAPLAITPPTLPAGEKGVAYTATVLATGGVTPYVFSGTLPVGLSISAAGAISGTPNASFSGPVTINVKDALNNNATSTPTLTINGAVTFPTPTLPVGTVGVAYSATVAAVPTGGVTPYTFSGTLPVGLSISSAGVISGTPSGSYNAQVTINVKDSVNNTASATPTLTINAPLAITPPTLPVGEQGVAYTATVVATGGVQPYTFSGTLPVGLSISSAGVISGTPSGSYNAQITINVKDNVNNTASATPTLTINGSLAITPPTLPVGEQGVAYTATVVATGGITPYAFSGTLPVGLSISAAGAISGTPTGTFSGPITINVKDNINATATTTPTLTVNAPLAITPPTLPVGEQGVAYTATVVATGGITPYTFSGTLPVGLSISAAGAISGTPTGTFSGPITINVKDNVNATATSTPTLTVNAPLAITPPTLPVGEQGVAYTATVVATGGITPYTFSGTLPVGLSISAAGQITGTPSGTFNAPVTINVKDGVNSTATSTPTLTVNAPLAITPPTLPVGTVGVAYTTTVAATGGITPYTFSGTLPVGLSISAAGQITGTPSGTFNAPVTINVKDGVNSTATSSPTLTVNAPLAITPPTLPVGIVGTAYTATVLATGGVQPYTFSGTLPVGLSISAAGVISGLPTGTFSGPITINVKDNANNTATSTPTLTINGPLAVATTSLPTGTQGVAYTAPLAANGGLGSYTFSAAGLPSGLSVSGSQITGTPGDTFSGNVTITVTDSASHMASATLPLTIVAQTGASSILVNGVSVGAQLQVQSTFSLSTAAPNKMLITLTSSDPSKMLLSSGVTTAGTGQIQIVLTTGDTTSGFYVQGVAASTSPVTITATAQNYINNNPTPSSYIPGMASVSVTPSGFTLTGPNGAGASFVTSASSQTTLTVDSVQLDANGNILGSQPVAGGLSILVPFTDGTPAAGSVSPASVTFAGNQSELTTTFTGGAVASGSASTTITATEPAGFQAPQVSGLGVNSLFITVNASSMTAANVTVGQSLEAATAITLQGVAPDSPGSPCPMIQFGPLAGETPLPVLVSSNSPDLQLSTTSSGTGSSSITVCVPPGTSTGNFYAYGLTNTGTATYTATASGFGTSTGTVTFAPSGIVIYGTDGIPGDSFTWSAVLGLANIGVESGLVDNGGNFISAQNVAGNTQVTITSSNSSVGTVGGPPGTASTTVTIPAGTSGVTSVFDPGTCSGTGCNTVLSVNVPAGFNTTTAGSVTVNFLQTRVGVTTGTTIGSNLEVAGLVNLGAPVSSDVQVTLTSNNAAALLLSSSATGAGLGTITITVPAGSQTAAYYLQAVGSSGTVTYTGTATGYSQGTGTLTLTPGGFVIVGPGGFDASSYQFNLATTIAHGQTPTALTIESGWVDSFGNFYPEMVAPGAAGNASYTATAGVTSGHGALTSTSFTFTGGQGSATTSFTSQQTGLNTVTVTQPSGFTPPGYFTHVQLNVTGL